MMIFHSYVRFSDSLLDYKKSHTNLIPKPCWTFINRFGHPNTPSLAIQLGIGPMLIHGFSKENRHQLYKVYGDFVETTDQTTNSQGKAGFATEFLASSSLFRPA
jgi:hypothetical protein